MEVLNKIILLDFRRHFIGPDSEISWLIQVTSIPDNPFKVMEGIEGLLRAPIRLLDAGKLGHVPPPTFASNRPDTFLFLFEGASILDVSIDSLIENTLYSGVVFLLRRIRQVEILG